MPFKYDFDIKTITPEDFFSDPQTARLMALSGITFDSLSNKIPLFRDPKTAAALRAAPDDIKELFLDAGFGFDTYNSGAPDGYFPAKDADAREQFITKLNQSLARTPSIANTVLGLNVVDFLRSQKAAEPINPGDYQPQQGPSLPDLLEGHAIVHPSNSIFVTVMSATFGLLCGLALLAYTALELLK